MVLNLHQEVRANKSKSNLIIILFFLFIGFLGIIIGSVFSYYYTGLFDLIYLSYGFFISIVVALIYLLIFMSNGDKMILQSTGAKEASRKNYPYLYHTTEALSIAAGMSKPPKCYVIDSPALNAYATGFKPENSYVVVTTGLLKKLNRQEIEGVLAHEISHIKNQDIKVMLLAAGLVGVTVLISHIMFRAFIFAPHGGGGKKGGGIFIVVAIIGFIILILSPLVAQMIKMAISRRREYLADSSGALLTRYPEGLASALEKIKNDKGELKNSNGATAHLFISNPLKNNLSNPFSGLFSTHPPIDDRINILRGKNKSKQ